MPAYGKCVVVKRNFTLKNSKSDSSKSLESKKRQLFELQDELVCIKKQRSILAHLVLDFVPYFCRTDDARMRFKGVLEQLKAGGIACLASEDHREGDEDEVYAYILY